MKKHIQVIINPASGQPKPILHTLNRVFHKSSFDWDISLTKESGDARRFATQASQSGADVVAAFGGDGTVMEVAMGVLGSQTPMAILPGGTANLMSVELGIPKDLEKAATVACDEASQVRSIDVGQIGDQHFLLRVGLGFAARKVELADRELKDKYGILAYSIAGLKALKDTKRIQYRITIDNELYEGEGLSCLIDNAGNIGIPGVAPVKGIEVTDGLLDIILIKAPIPSSADTTIITSIKTKKDILAHWQGREIKIETDPPQSIQVDGEMLGQTPVSINIIPQAVRVITPAAQ
jgi:YegS/Rv2252/BmrU family lipid kinase